MAPKATIKAEKKQYLDELTKTLKSASSFMFVDYSGMDVASQQNLKKSLAEKGAKMLVAKNTLIRLAGENAGLPSDAFDSQTLSGQTAIIFSNEDPVEPVQILGKFISENEKPAFKAGLVEGKFQDKVGLLAISKLPSREQLYANAIGAIAGPMYGIIGTLQANLQKLVFILDQASKKEAQAAN